ncbi:hypothetical protein KL907_001791 [Ogataea polymorpha]|nr:hypothetical protein KL908_000908 [Ogataea polymorpha]KAG7908301.1 hypothetical protein KL907_001791 [Ogataea polymorpha]
MNTVFSANRGYYLCPDAEEPFDSGSLYTNGFDQLEPTDDELMAELSDREKPANESALHELCSGDDKVLKFHEITVYREDILNLRDDEWLNDNNLAFIYEYITRVHIEPTLRRRIRFANQKMIETSIILLMPAFTFLLAHHPEPTQLRGVLPPIEKAKFVFMPLNDNEDLGVAEGGYHWSLVVLSVEDRLAMVYDSMESANEQETKQLVSKIEQYYGFKFRIITDLHPPQQSNGSDCGISVAGFTAILVARLLKAEDKHKINMSMENVSFSALDARLFVLKCIKRLRDETEAR